MDPRVSQLESAKCTDFNVSNYVRGTLANFGELFSAELKLSTHHWKWYVVTHYLFAAYTLDSLTSQYFTNQIPQLHSFYQSKLFVCTHTFVYAVTCIVVYMCMHVPTHPSIHTYTHMYIHTYVHTYTHTCFKVLLWCVIYGVEHQW